MIAEIERESLQKTGLRSDVVTLYQGGEYWLYRYKKYTDVRLVFAPEQQIAFFGGDPDNFTYPRYDLDMALFRVYENGKPIESNELPEVESQGRGRRRAGVRVRPSRLDRRGWTRVAQLEAERDLSSPRHIKLLQHRIAALEQYSRTAPEQARQAGTEIFGLENASRRYEGRLQGPARPAVMAKKRSRGAGVPRRGDGQPRSGRPRTAAPGTPIAEAEKKAATRVKERFFHSLDSQLGGAGQQHRAVRRRDQEARRRAAGRLSRRAARIAALSTCSRPRPIYPRHGDRAHHRRARTGPGRSWGRTTRSSRSCSTAARPHEAAPTPGERHQAGRSRRSASSWSRAAKRRSPPPTDPMIVLARKLDPMRRELIKWTEDNVQSVEQRAGEQLGQARFAVYGKTTYPDATFTLRLSYGTGEGLSDERHQGAVQDHVLRPLRPRRQLRLQAALRPAARATIEGRDKLDLSTPLNFVTTNDIIGGNSGSPVINRAGELVGLIFDGNIESLVGDFVYDGETNRAVAVHTAAHDRGAAEALQCRRAAERTGDSVSIIKVRQQRTPHSALPFWECVRNCFCWSRCRSRSVPLKRSPRPNPCWDTSPATISISPTTTNRATISTSWRRFRIASS